jgi:Flp pilus assembly protein TadB
MLHSADLQMTILEYLLIWVLCIAGGCLRVFRFAGWLPAVLVGAIGALIPYMMLRYRVSKRLRAFNNQLSNVLSGCQLHACRLWADAGARLCGARDSCAGRSRIRDGRARCEAGASTMAALDGLLDRVESDDLRLVVVDAYRLRPAATSPKFWTR